MKKWALLLLTLAGFSASAAEEFDWRKFYLGVGFGSAAIDQVDEYPNVLQYFVGYPLLHSVGSGGIERFRLALEGGYTTVSDYEQDSYWVAPLLSYGFNSELNGLLRLGVEMGDSQGVVGAVGVTYMPAPVFGVRLELVEREASSLTMVNLIYRP